MFQSDDGGAYVSTDVKNYFEQRDIQHRTTVSYDPQSNGIAERFNRTITDVAESMRIRANLPEQFWSLFISHAVYLLNRRAHSALSGETPFEAWWGRKPDVRHLRVAGCGAWVLRPVAKRRAQDRHARRGIFTGDAPTQKAYRVWDVEKIRVVVSQHVLCNADRFTFGRDITHQPSP